ncbi:MAG TPA: protein-glutamate O-methyltransferase [Syntrophorhabdaceae bacterium]|nr:protein-glutamate O-methyltransferase [Syntrophorhabdaceae bacterium]
MNNEDQFGRHDESMVGMSRDVFSRLQKFIYSESGIKLTDVKKTMLESRLQKRLRALGMHSFSDYCDYVLSAEGIEHELTAMIDQVTTNKTDFFREPAHFEYLISKVVPVLNKSQRHLMIWSAGCSSGEEPYTLAMVMQNYIDNGGKTSFSILATDISTRVLEKARIAVYDQERISAIPSVFQKKFLLRSKDKSKGIYRIVPDLRKHVQFRRVNFMEGDFGFREDLDVIFCRNVIIYFDKQTQERLLRKFCNCLSPGGHIFMGHSETILGMDLPLVQVAPTVYRCDR